MLSASINSVKLHSLLVLISKGKWYQNIPDFAFDLISIQLAQPTPLITKIKKKHEKYNF